MCEVALGTELGHGVVRGRQGRCLEGILVSRMYALMVVFEIGKG